MTLLTRGLNGVPVDSILVEISHLPESITLPARALETVAGREAARRFFVACFDAEDAEAVAAELEALGVSAAVWNQWPWIADEPCAAVVDVSDRWWYS